ncbi:MAG: bacterio-opsin activator domain-containing protein [Haloarculaceae archaeon]
MDRVRVVVAGTSRRGVERTAAGLEQADDGLAVETAVGEYGGDDEAVDCLVSRQLDFPEIVERMRSAHGELPVVVFASADASAVRDRLTEPSVDYVQRRGEERYAVLASRVRSAAETAERAAELDRFRGIVDALDDGVYALDDEGHVTFANEAMAELTGYSLPEIIGNTVDLVKDPETVEASRRAVTELLSEGADSTGTTMEVRLQRKDGTWIDCEDHMALLYDDGEFRGTAGVIRDITDRKQRREMLAELQETSRALMQAPSREAVAEIVAGSARKVLGFDLAVVHLYDAGKKRLVPAATTDAIEDELGVQPGYDLNEPMPGEVFASGDPVLDDDVAGGGPVRSAMYFPIGVHGTLSILSTDEDAFDDIDRQTAGLLATNAAAACNRAKREQEVREARERVATMLDRINGLVEDTVEVLVGARTREEVEQGVCEQLATADPYAFAWLGRPDVRGERMDVVEWDGCPEFDPESVDIDMDGDDPGVEAYETDEPVVTQEPPTEDGWLARAQASGLGSVMAIPLSYRDSNYGVLYVCADERDAFDERERVVLEALGRAVANAINAIESGRILSANEVIELEFTVEDEQLLFSRLSAATGGRLESATITQEDEQFRLYLSVEGCEPVLDQLREDEAVSDATLVADQDGEALVDVTARCPLVERLVDHGAVPKAVAGEDGIARYTVELPYEADAREVFGIVEDNYDRTSLTGYHEHERPVRTPQEFRTSVAERLTDRQETALRTAFLGGFFEWPREVDGEDLATAMDISRPTYHQHLRAAQLKVFEELFEGGYAE